jgi:uncharacterized protein (TIGR02001 family)
MILAAAPMMPPAVSADDASGDSPHQFSANVLMATEYLYRGISQSNEDPALQGGFDYSHETIGFYVGFWASSIEFNAQTTNTASIETNFYGGFAGEFSNGVSWDVGGLYYYYPDSNEDTVGDFNFVEVYGNLGYTFEASWDPTVDIGFAYSPDFFGEDDDGIYVHGRISFALPSNIGVYSMIGYQDVNGDKTSGPAGFDYVHYAVGATYDFGILTFDGSWNDANDDCGVGDICEAFVFSVSSSW